jgi:diguanylate cyclase (GGDEF)-like protein/PAS domain S-box-containing protein
MQRSWKNWGLSTKWTITYVFLIVIVSGSMTLGVYFRLVDTQRQSFQERLGDILNLATPQVDGDFHALLQLPADQDGPFYRVIHERLKTIQDSSSIIHRIYTLRIQDETQLSYVVDASKENPQTFGTQYEYQGSPLDLALLLRITEPILESTLKTGEYGTYLQGYAPIYDHFGELDAILSIEIDAATMLANEAHAREIAILGFLASIPLALLVGVWLARFLTSPISELVKGAERIAQGDLSKPVPVYGQDELGTLSTSFNHMTSRLKETLGGLEKEIVKYQWAEKVQGAIFRISQTVISTNSMGEMYHSIQNILGELIPVDNFFIALFDEKNDRFSFPYYIDQYDPPPESHSFRNGLTEYVIRTKRSLFINRDDFQTLLLSGDIEVVGTPPVQWLGVPLIVEGRILGVVAVQSYSDEVKFDKDNLHLMEFVSSQIALAIEHKSAAEMVRKSNERYRVLFEDSPISLWEEDFSGVKQIIDDLQNQQVTDFRSYLTTHPEIVTECAKKVRVLDVNKATLELFDAQSKEEILKDLSDIFIEESYPHFKEELIYIAEGKTDFSWDGVNQTLQGKRIEVSISWSVVPGHFDDLSKVIVSMLDITERRMTEKKLLYISSHDALTGLYNRAYFEEEMYRLERGRHFPVSVIMVDVDKLKIINDRDGHAAGDAMLQQTAKVLNSVFRAEDVIARIGGDEFAILLPDINESGADKAIQRIRNKIQRQNTNGNRPPLSLSIGRSTAEKAGNLSAALIQADTNMYLDKYSKQKVGGKAAEIDK